MHVSHETIYLSLFVQSRGVLKKALQAQLRQRHTIRRTRTAAPKSGGYIVGAVSIRERPATVEDRAVPGHWEGDLLVGARQSYVATLVERRSRYVCLVRVAGRETRTVVQALTEHVRRLPDGLMATLTWDRGLELAAHRTFSIATGVQVYFCDPYSPWQRGTNENTNGLLRQYLPKGTNLARYTQPQLDAIARELNTRPHAARVWSQSRVGHWPMSLWNPVRPPEAHSGLPGSSGSSRDRSALSRSSSRRREAAARHRTEQ